MLHIVDYDERENVNNCLLRAFTWDAVLMAFSGLVAALCFPKVICPLLSGPFSILGLATKETRDGRT